MASMASDTQANPTYSLIAALRNTALVVPCFFTSAAAFLLLARSHLYTDPLQPQQALLVGSGVIAVTAILRLLSGFPTASNKSAIAKCSWYLQSLTVLQVMLLLLVTSESPQNLAALWTLALGTESAWWILNHRHGQPAVRPQAGSDFGDHHIENELENRLLRALEETSVDESSTWSQGEMPDHANQFWLRTVDLHGESILASQRVQFHPGQRHQNIHFSFVPGLPSIPHVEAISLEGPDVEISVGEKQDFGIRLDLRLSRVYDEPVEVLIQIEVFAESQKAA